VGLAAPVLLVVLGAALAWAPAARLVVRDLVAVVVVAVAALVAAYAVGPFEIDWWLRTSAERVSIGAFLIAALAGLLAVDALVDVAAERDQTGTGAPPAAADA
jgi:hypothetical protein